MGNRAPILAPTPFKKIKTPVALEMALDAHVKLHPFKVITVPVEWHDGWRVFHKHGVYDLEKKDVLVKENLIPPSIEDLAYKTLTPEIVEWSQTPVRRTWAYGVREYTYGCRLAMHRDRKDTHVLSAIVHVADSSNTPWALDFIDHSGVHHEVYMKKGETLLYESFCPHGRNTPFQGSYFRNCYFHWAPEEWNDTKMLGVQTEYHSLAEALADMAPKK